MEITGGNTQEICGTCRLCTETSRSKMRLFGSTWATATARRRRRRIKSTIRWAGHGWRLTAPSRTDLAEQMDDDWFPQRHPQSARGYQWQVVSSLSDKCQLLSNYLDEERMPQMGCRSPCKYNKLINRIARSTVFFSSLTKKKGLKMQRGVSFTIPSGPRRSATPPLGSSQALRFWGQGAAVKWKERNNI